MAKYRIDYFQAGPQGGPPRVPCVVPERYFHPDDATAKVKKSLIYILTTPYQLGRSVHQELTFPVYDPRVAVMAAGKIYV